MYKSIPFHLELIRLQQNDLAYFLQNVIGAITIMPSDSAQIKLELYYSGNIYHSSTILVNLIDNTILKSEIPGLVSDFNIETTYVPLRRYNLYYFYFLNNPVSWGKNLFDESNS